MSSKDFEPEERTVVVVIANIDYGRVYKKIKKGQREMFFIDKIKTEYFGGPTVITGRYLIEFERKPEDTLPLKCKTSLDLKSICVRYEKPTEEEMKEFKVRLSILKKQGRNLRRNKYIDKILSYLE